nr:topless-related protein 4-like isoform X1 [Ipomoea batatas]
MAADMEKDDLLHLVLQFLRKENYKETLHSVDKKNALRILRDELNVFAVFDKVYFKETAHLMVLDNIREAPHLSNYVDTQTTRASLLNKLKRLIIQNPLLRDKLLLPTLPEDHACEQLNNINADQRPLSPVNDSPGVNNVNSSDNISNTVVANLSQGSSV